MKINLEEHIMIQIEKVKHEHEVKQPVVTNFIQYMKMLIQKLVSMVLMEMSIILVEMKDIENIWI